MMLNVFYKQTNEIKQLKTKRNKLLDVKSQLTNLIARKRIKIMFNELL